MAKRPKPKRQPKKKLQARRREPPIQIINKPTITQIANQGLPAAQTDKTEVDTTAGRNPAADTINAVREFVRLFDKPYRPFALGCLGFVLIALLAFGFRKQISDLLYTPTPYLTQSPQLSAPVETVAATPAVEISVGLIEIPDDPYPDIKDRLIKLGFDVSSVSSGANYYALSKYKVIYLPSGWSRVGAVTADNSEQFRAYLEQGGGLLVEQPNADAPLTPAVLPFAATFASKFYDRNEWPPVIVDSDHYITKGLPGDEMPGPGDPISYIDAHYKVLVQGASTGSPSLAVADFGKGRIVISAGNASIKNNEFPIADEVLRRMILWVAGAEQ